jgi:hypothetical protein
VAAQYIEAAGSDRLEVELVKVAMLHTAAEFVALGLVRVFLGYTPNCHALRFLFGLCGQFTGLVEGVFPQDDTGSLRRYKMLCAPVAMLRHWERLGAAEEDFDLLEKGCVTFLAEARKVSFEKIDGLLKI